MPTARTRCPARHLWPQSLPAGSRASPALAAFLTRPWPSRTAPGGRAEHRPLHLPGGPGLRPGPAPRDRALGPHTGFRPLARLRSAQGEDLSRVGPLFGAPVWMPLHSLETIPAPFWPHVPGISRKLALAMPWAGPLNHWPSGRGVPRRHHSGVLPASPSQCRRAATILVSAVRSRSTPAVHSSGWRGRQEPGG